MSMIGNLRLGCLPFYYLDFCGEQLGLTIGDVLEAVPSRFKHIQYTMLDVTLRPGRIPSTSGT